MYIIIAVTCDGCGNKAAVMLHDKGNRPTPEEVDELVDKLGGNYCIHKTVIEINPGEIVETEL